MSHSTRVQAEPSRFPAATAAETAAATAAAAAPTDPPLSINEDAKRFAGQLQEEILTRLHRESAKLDELFDAQSFR